MSITVLQSTATLTGLQPQGGPARPITQPPCAFRGIDVDLAGAAPHQTGIWECTPGRWRRQIVAQEFCHFIQGRCTFTPDDGETLYIEAGDALMLPANTTGVWDIQETLRKTYVLIF